MAECEGIPPIIILNEVGSTNEELVRLARTGLAHHGSALLARAQTSGRGRRAHRWSSPAGGLYLSVAIEPGVPASQLPGIPVACGIGVLEALHDAGCARARLKWPNDVVVGRGKLGGILVELACGKDRTLAVCGIGINIAPPRCAALEKGALGATSLAECLEPGTAVPDSAELAALVREHVLDSCRQWSLGLHGLGPDAAPLEGILDVYNDKLAFRGQRVNISPVDGDPCREGRLLGIDALGRAMVETLDGIEHIDASLASIRPI